MISTAFPPITESSIGFVSNLDNQKKLKSINIVGGRSSLSNGHDAGWEIYGDNVNKQLLEETGLGALAIQSDACEDIIEENKQALDLVSRSVVVLIVFIAVMTVFGWLS